jgi:hypothetical protein
MFDGTMGFWLIGASLVLLIATVAWLDHVTRKIDGDD